MDLTLQSPGDHYFIRSVSDKGICVVEQWFQESLVISASHLITDWSVTRFDEINELQLQTIFDLEPDVVLLGTGRKQHFLPAEKMMLFYQRGIGAEVMSTDAACRTFNVLVSEERRVVAALLPLHD